MKRFASHRIYIPYLDLLLRNHVVEVDDISGDVSGYYPFVDEIPYTEWLNGLIVLSCSKPCISFDVEPQPTGDSVVLFIDSNKNIRSVLPFGSDKTSLTLKAYYITSFNVSDMCFSGNGSVIQLL